MFESLIHDYEALGLSFYKYNANVLFASIYTIALYK